MLAAIQSWSWPLSIFIRQGLLVIIEAHALVQASHPVNCTWFLQHCAVQILAGDVDEDYFKQHTSFRSQLQHLAATALEPDRLLQQQEDTEQQRQSATWEGCSGMQLQEQQLLWLLDVWGKQRMVLLGQLVPGAALTGVEAQQLQQLQQQWRRLLSQRSGEGEQL